MFLSLRENKTMMKNVLIIITLSTLVFSCVSEENTNLEELVVNVEQELGESYGPVEVNIDDAISVEAMITDFADKKDETEYTFEGDMIEICSKAGCWVNIDKGNGETFMVRFKDHFTIPTDTEAETGAYFHGTIHWDTVSVDMLQHFAEDAGKSEEEIAQITEQKFEMGFEADGITLKK